MFRSHQTIAATLRLAILGGVVCAASSCGQGAAASAPRPASADSIQKSIVRGNLNRPGDPELVAQYQAINERHFQGLLPSMPVRWEPRLSEVDARSADGLKLLGTFGKIGERSVILLHPSLKANADDLARALSHEMVHAYLSTTLGDEDTAHGLSYQAVLRRLALEGAFIGIPSTEVERADLRAWLDQQATKLDSEGAVAVFNREVERYNLMLVYPDGMDKGQTR